MKKRMSLLMFMLMTCFSWFPAVSQTDTDDNLVVGGNMEIPESWQITDFAPDSTTEIEFGYNESCPSFGEGGCLRVYQGESFGQVLIWQRITLEAGQTYRATGAIRTIDYNPGTSGTGGVWYQLYIDPAEVDEQADDYNPGGIKFFNMDSWQADFQGSFDGLWEDLNLGGGIIEAPFYVAPGTPGESVDVTFGIKFGHNWADLGGTNFEITVDELGLFPVDPSVDVAAVIEGSLDSINVDINLHIRHTVGGCRSLIAPNLSTSMPLKPSQTGKGLSRWLSSWMVWMSI